MPARLDHCGACRSRDVGTGLDHISCHICAAKTYVDGRVEEHRQGGVTTAGRNL